MFDSNALAFAGLAALLTVTPGADMALVTRNALRNGLSSGVMSSIGIVLGVFIWGALSALGVAAVVAASDLAFYGLKFGGGVYLVYLGAKTLLSRPARSEEKAETAPRARDSLHSLREGLTTNLLNPKIGVFYTTVLPQFIDPSDPVFLKSVFLAGIHCVMGMIWLVGYSAALVGARRVVTSKRFEGAMQKLTGLALVSLGLRLAVSKR